VVSRVVVGAHYGLRDWLVQRITAAMALYSVALAGWLMWQPYLDYDTWTALFAGGWMRIGTLMFLLSLFWHAWIGVRDVAMDYVKPAGVRLAIHVLAILALVFYAIWSVQILWGM
jgi:succinate dehydrogenase / fumarate reductase membrane anchor subunit